MDSDAIAQAYRDYLQRFEEAHGPLEVGAFAKQEGRLIRKLAEEEFSAFYTEYVEMVDFFKASVERGDTMNDVVVKTIRERSAELLLPRPI
jgi:hypothetical protein